MAGEDRTEHSRRYGSSGIPTTMSHAPVATRTLSVVGNRPRKAGLRWFFGLILAGAAGAAAFAVLPVIPRKAAPSAALVRPTPVAPTAAAKAARALAHAGRIGEIHVGAVDRENRGARGRIGDDAGARAAAGGCRRALDDLGEARIRPVK